MRGLRGLRGSALSLSTPSTSPARTNAVASLRRGESSAQNLVQLPLRRPQHWNVTVRPQTRCLSTSAARLQQEVIPNSAPHHEDALLEEAEAATEMVEEVHTEFVFPPPTRQPVMAAEDITSPDYVAAETADGLEEIGGLEGWWDKEGHWPETMLYRGFGPLEKVTDPAVLEVLVRRAVVEALVLQHFAKNGTKVPSALTTSLGDALAAAGTEIVEGPDGAATLKDEADFQRIWDSLSSAAAENTDTEASTEPSVSAEEARDLIKSWGSGWKALRLDDPVLKFYAAKRIQLLTGHRIPDAKLMGLQTVKSFVAHLVEKPKPKKLAEQIQETGILSSLHNVQVVPRRVTPVDKDKAEGRWKVIEAQLKKRGLPVFGTAGYGKAIEKSWVGGDA